MKSLHFTVLVVGFLFMVAVLYPLAVFAYEAVKNPDTAIRFETEDQGDTVEFRLIYNINISINDAVLVLNITLDNGTVISLTDTDESLHPGEALTLTLDKNQLIGHNVTSTDIKLAGEIGGVFPITIELGQGGGG